ncbi:toll-like receptor 3 [Rhincodon typus]|uniref:toll-like receptor 3 n=1 Tax=Rhincodon typus TaxID=259920 RepID=UPI00202FDEE6|nr:toll-like receptor 3 [Rhincodon typus]
MKMYFQAITLYFAFAIWYYGARASGTQCKIQDLVVDCRHLKLSSVPSDLPVNITVLNLSHNQLKHLPASALSRYSQLQALDSGYNVITKIEENLCKVLPFLQTLGLEHNQLSQLSVHYFSYCSNLTELYIQFNRIKEITGDPFTNLQELTVLDVSHNKLASAKLGTEPQLQKLQRLVLSANKITQLKNDDFDFLNTSTLYQLDLSSNSIAEFEPGCFRKIGSLHGLLLDNVVLSSRLAKQLCGALSHTDIAELSLRNTHLKIERSTFAELNKTNLTVLDLSNNRLTMLQNNSFQWLHSLEYLQLENNSIKHVIPKTFAGLENLRYLNLKKGLTQAESVIDDYSFQELGNLVELNLEYNNIARIKAHTFSGLRSLKFLSLYKASVVDLNTITNETFMSLAESPLVSLNLTKTKISKLQPGAFSWLKKLKKLDIGLNSIAQILTGEEFRGLTEIEVIYLSYNSKLILSSKSFIHVPSLKILMLSKSAIVSLSLEPSPFDCIKNLTVLDLSNNNLANLDKDVFRELQQLQVLKLQHNNLARLWKSVNPGGPVLYLSGLKELQILDLQSNGLDELPEKAFQGLYKLNNLDLSLNNLNFLPDVVFDDLKSLKLLHVQKNLITSVEKDVFNQLASCRRLNTTAHVLGHHRSPCPNKSAVNATTNEWISLTVGLSPVNTTAPTPLPFPNSLLSDLVTTLSVTSYQSDPTPSTNTASYEKWSNFIPVTSSKNLPSSPKSLHHPVCQPLSHSVLPSPIFSFHTMPHGYDAHIKQKAEKPQESPQTFKILPSLNGRTPNTMEVSLVITEPFESSSPEKLLQVRDEQELCEELQSIIDGSQSKSDQIKHTCFHGHPNKELPELFIEEDPSEAYNAPEAHRKKPVMPDDQKAASIENEVQIPRRKKLVLK